MPEGDSIDNVARAMRPLLVGQRLVRVVAGGVEHPALAGVEVVAVEPFGKHLVVTTARGTELRTHLGMNGRWWRHPADAPPPPRARGASLVLATAADLLVCTRAMRVELVERRDPRRGVAVARLGPDLLAPDVDLAAVLARARQVPPNTPVGDLLLDQRVAAGLGNVYRCELLFLARLAPSTPVGALGDDALAALYRHGRDLLQRNVAPRPGGRSPGPRRTRVDGPVRYWVYRQAGRPCPRCRAPIASATVGAAVRRLYWCPGCQRPAPAAAPAP